MSENPKGSKPRETGVILAPGFTRRENVAVALREVPGRGTPTGTAVIRTSYGPAKETVTEHDGTVDVQFTRAIEAVTEHVRVTASHWRIAHATKPKGKKL
jgi:hypothetical protein